MSELAYSPRKYPRILLVGAVGLATLALPVLGQSNAPATPTANALSPDYEVVSIRPNNSGSPNSGDHVNGGLFSADNETLLQLIFGAFARLAVSDQGIVMPDQIKGLPGWAYSERFNVEAKMDADSAISVRDLPLKQLLQRHQPLLRAALADRFQLRTHYEIREGSVYELVIAKGGSKLKESNVSEDSGLAESNGHWEGRSYPIGWLAFNLSGELGRIVVDKTGLAGKYSFALNWTPDDRQGSLDAGPTLFTALQEQLGLKIVAAKGPVTILVIDHVERPSAN